MDAWLLMGVTALAIGGARAAYTAVVTRQTHQRRLPANRRRTRIDQTSDGPARVGGRARRRGDLVKGPLSGRACIAFELMVEEEREGHWSRCLHLLEARPFTLSDDSGEALVDTAGSFELALVPSVRGYTGWFRRGRREHLHQLRKLLGARDVPIGHTTTHGGWRRFRYEESLLEEGAELWVAGNAAHDVLPDGERTTPRGPPRSLVLRGSADQPLLISSDA
jgi:hypothetical protein